MGKHFRNIFGRNGAGSGGGLPGPQSVNIQRSCYAMATVNGDEAEITMYGEIVEKRPIDWWTGKPVEGDFIILDEFLEDLKAVAGAKKLTIRLNSVGGNVFAALPIHNKLREFKAEKTVIVDGVALSAGSMIMCAGDTVQGFSTSLVMIHKCAVMLIGWFQARELSEIIEQCNSVDKAIAAAYVRHTGLDEDEILSMMEETTWMTGAEAVEKGFFDELLEDEDAPEIAASADRTILYVNGKALSPHFTAQFSRLPDSIPTVQPKVQPAQAAETNTKPATTGGKKGGTLMAKNLEELRNENPELAAQVEADLKAAAPDNTEAIRAAVAQERQRLKEIDEIAPAINDAELVAEAKYGEHPCTAQDLAFRAMKKQAGPGAAFLENMKADYAASGAGNVPASPNGGEDDPVAKVNAAVDAGVAAAIKALGGK